MEDSTDQVIAAIDPGASLAVPEFETPDAGAFQRVTLRHGSREVRLGGDPGEVERAFDPPSRTFPIGELPFEEGELTVTGWQSANEGLGIISREGRVVLVLHTFERASERLADDLIDQYGALSRNLHTEIQGDNVRYWFWQDNRQRLMLVRHRDRRGNLHVTVALGVIELMNVLRMDPDSAQEDADRADELLSRNRTASASQ